MPEHKRVKHGQHPGDIHKKYKIRMREKRGLPIYFRNDWIISEAAAKVYRKMLVKKGKKSNAGVTS